MPDWKRIVQERMASFELKPSAEAGLVDEIAQHLEDRYTELRSAGASEADAERSTRAELGNMAELRDGLRPGQRMPRREPVTEGEPSSAGWFAGVGRDVRFAARSMKHSPVFVLFVVLTLALGIGANTTVFTLINTLVLNPLPVRDSSSLMALVSVDTKRSAQATNYFPLSHANFEDYRDGNRVFESLAAFSPTSMATWMNHGTAQSVFVELASGNYFTTLGLTPARGRFFLPDEDGAAGAHPVAVLNYTEWQKDFGGAEDIVGRQIEINNVNLTVVGVAPPHFIGVNSIFGPNLWAPAAMAESLFPNTLRNGLTDRAKAEFFGIGRLRPGVTRKQAEANMGAIGASLAQSFPAVNEGHTAEVRPVSDVLLASSGGSGGPLVFASVALMLVVGIVLLIACSNVANLLLARSASRQQELAVRLAMGASRFRLIRQLLTESVALAVLSGALGLFFAYFGLQLVFGQLPQGANFPRPKLDATVFLYALAISLLTGLLFGMLPAWKASRANVADALKESGRAAGRSRGRVNIGNALLVGQVAFSFLLLVTAALFLRSIARAYQIDTGFQTAHLVVFPANPGQAGFNRARVKTFYDDVQRRVRSLPGVESSGWSSNMPLWARTLSGVDVEGRQSKSRADQLRAVVITVGGGYFETAGIRMEQGRSFDGSDQEQSLPVAIVNEKLARDYWPDGAVGKTIQLPGEKSRRQVVGVAKTANYTAVGEPAQPAVYAPMEQKFADSMVLYVRSKGDPHELVQPVNREIRASAPEVLVFGTRTGSEIIDGGLFQAKMAVGLLTAFGLLALGLASIGLYGVLAYSVSQRKREIGLRMALGSSRAGVLLLVLREGMGVVLVGVVIGFAASLALGRLLSTMLFGVGASDLVSLGAAAGAMAVVALAACYWPARGATRVAPVEALREG